MNAPTQQNARMFRTLDFLVRTCDLPPDSLAMFEPCDEYRRGDLIAAMIASTAFQRGGFTIGRVRRITRTRVALESDRGTFVFNLPEVAFIGKAVACWRPADVSGARDDEEWPEYIDAGEGGGRTHA